MAHLNRLGFTKLASSDRKGAGIDRGEDGRVNIIFVHGLRGHPYDTWASSQQQTESPHAVGTLSSSRSHRIRSIFKSSAPQNGESMLQRQVFWPQDYLAEDIPQARVWTYGYTADVIGGLFRASSKDSVSQHGRNLALRLEREVDNEDPIIFVAHSLGGILVKDALNRSEASRKRTRFIVFLGTPHRGSEAASWGQMASNLARLALQDSNKKILETLKVDSEVFDNIHENFVFTVSQHNIRVHSFREGQGISGVKGLHGKVVHDFSSRLDLPTLETVESINANHMQMARCSNRRDESYRAIAGVLKQFLKNADLKTYIPIRPATYAQQGGITSAQHETHNPRTSTVYCNVPARNRRFVGRTQKLKELEERLIVSSACRIMALVVLGGMGKTQVALQLAYIVKRKLPDCSIFWVSAVSGESFEQSYREIANGCSITLSPMEEDPKETVRKYLSGNMAGRWLLVVDNADDQEILFGASDDAQGVADFLPNSEDGLILFTTRYRQIAVQLANKEVADLSEMTEEEAEVFLGESLTRTDLLQDKAATAELLTELTYLPLAIAQAAAYLNNARQLSLREYLSLLKDTEEDTISLLSREFRDETRPKNKGLVKNAVARTWFVSFEHIRRLEPVAADLLSFISCIEHKAIPRHILPEVESAEQMVHDLGTLHAYAFLNRREDSDIYDMHRLVHLATKVWLGDQRAIEDSNKKATIHLAKIFPYDYYSNRFIWREYLPHTFRLLENTDDQDLAAWSELCIRVGRCLKVDGRIEEAVSWLSKCYLWRKSHFPEDDPSRLLSQHTLAGAYLNNGQVTQGLELIKHVVAIRNKVLQEDHPDRIASQHELAVAYQANGQIREAVNTLEHVVTINKALREDHSHRLASQQNLAIAYLANRQVKQAVELLEHVVTVQKVLREDYPGRLVSQHELAIAYLANRQIRQAVEILEHVVTVQKVLREDHPHRLVSEHELARAYLENGQVKHAVELLEHVVAVKKVLREDHPERLASQHELAGAYWENRLVRQAVQLLEHVVAVQKGVLAEDHPDRILSEEWLMFMREQPESSSEEDEQAENDSRPGDAPKVERHATKGETND